MRRHGERSRSLGCPATGEDRGSPGAPGRTPGRPHGAPHLSAPAHGPTPWLRSERARALRAAWKAQRFEGPKFGPRPAASGVSRGKPGPKPPPGCAPRGCRPSAPQSSAVRATELAESPRPRKPATSAAEVPWISTRAQPTHSSRTFRPSPWHILPGYRCLRRGVGTF